MDEAQRMKRNFLWNTAGQLVYVAAQWLLTILVLRLAPGEAATLYSGYLQTALTTTSVFLSLASFGMYSFQVSDAQNKYPQSAYIRSRLYTCTLSVLLCAGYVGVLALTSPAAYDGVQILCIFLFLGHRLVESVTDVYNAIEQKNGRLDLAGQTYALRGVVTVALFAVALYATGDLVLTLVLLLAGNAALLCFYTMPQARRFYQKQAVPQKAVLALLTECAPLAVYTFLNTTTAAVPKLMLERLLGTEALGVYGPVTAPVLLLTTCASYLFTPFINTFSDRYAARDAKGFYKALGGILAVVALMIAGGLFVAYVLGAWALRTFIDPRLASYAYLLPPMVWCAAGSAVVLFFSMVLTVMRCMKMLVAANLAAIVTAFAASFYFLPRFDLQGATYASCTALAVQIFCLAAALVKDARVHFAGKEMP